MKSSGFKNKGSGFKSQGGGLSSSSTLKSVSKLKNTKKVNAKSDKQKQIDKDYKVACEEVWKRDGGKCRGCGTTDRLSNSHLIPRSHRRDLVSVVKNIHIHCMDGDGIKGCHKKHEDQEWDDMLDGDVIVQTMKELDLQYYKRITL